MTQVSIDSPDFKLTDGIKKAVEKTGTKVEKYMDGMSLDCVIRKRTKDEVHILLKFKPRHGPEIQAEAQHFDFYHGLGIAQKRLIRQVSDLKGKRDDHKHQQETIRGQVEPEPDSMDSLIEEDVMGAGEAAA